VTGVGTAGDTGGLEGIIYHTSYYAPWGRDPIRKLLSRMGVSDGWSIVSAAALAASSRRSS
jgi:hypothetical protein